jgi:hypothetical protein
MILAVRILFGAELVIPQVPESRVELVDRLLPSPMERLAWVVLGVPRHRHAYTCEEGVREILREIREDWEGLSANIVSG